MSRARAHFVGLRDTRSRRGKRRGKCHAMVDVVLIALLAMALRQR